MTTTPPSASSPSSIDQVRSTALTVRLSRVGDWAWLHRVMPAVFPEIEPAYLRHMLCNLRQWVVVAVDEHGQRIGFCQFHRSSDAQVLWVNFIGVDPSVRRAGSGKAMLTWVEDRAAQLGCSRVELDVVTSNHGAITFYDRLGYQRVHTLVDDMGREKFRYIRPVPSQVSARPTSGLLPSRPMRAIWRLLYALRFGPVR